MAFRLSETTPNSVHGFLGHAKAEDSKLRKDPAFGGPCFEGTLQNASEKTSGFRIESRGREI
jgi:hypothetical protein